MVVLTLLAVFALAALVAVSAQAAGYTEIGSFGPGGPGSAPFWSLWALLLEQSTGDVYVYDGGKSEEEIEGFVYKLNAEGNPKDFSGLHTDVIERGRSVNKGGVAEIAVDNSNGPAKGDIYLATGKESFDL